MNRRIPTLLAAVVLTVTTAGCGSGTERAPSPDSGHLPAHAELQRALEGWLEQTDAPGAQLAVTDGTHTTTVAVGTTTPDGDEPMPTDAQLRIASATKPMVAAAVLQLVEAGDVDLDETIDAWFSDLPRASDITVAMLLQHTSGIPDYLDSDAYDALDDGPNQPWPRDGVLDAVATLPRAFEPGARHDYSNSNYHLLGLIVEDETGDDLLDVIAHEVIAPTGVDTIGLDDGTGPNPADVHGFDSAGGDRTTIEYAPMSAWRTAGWADGAGIASASELARWGWAYLASDAVLSDEMRAKAARATDAHADGARYVIFATDVDGTSEPAWFHSGGDPGYESLLVYFPDLDVAVAVTANAESDDDAPDPFDAARAAAEAFADAA